MYSCIVLDLNGRLARYMATASVSVSLDGPLDSVEDARDLGLNVRTTIGAHFLGSPWEIPLLNRWYMLGIHSLVIANVVSTITSSCGSTNFPFEMH